MWVDTSTCTCGGPLVVELLCFLCIASGNPVGRPTRSLCALCIHERDGLLNSKTTLSNESNRIVLQTHFQQFMSLFLRHDCEIWGLDVWLCWAYARGWIACGYAIRATCAHIVHHSGIAYSVHIQYDMLGLWILCFLNARLCYWTSWLYCQCVWFETIDI